MYLIFRYTTIFKTQGRLRHFVIGIYMAENCHLLRRTQGALVLEGRELYVLFFDGFSFFVLFLISVTLMDTPRRDTHSFES